MDVRPPVAALAVVLALMGCSGPAEERPSGSSSGAVPSSAGSSVTPSEEPSPSAPVGSEVPFPDVEPAGGPVMEEVSISMRAPTGWEQDPRAATDESGAAPPGGSESVALHEQDATGSLSLDEAAEVALEGLSSRGDVERLPDVTVDGQVMYRIAGSTPDSPLPWHEEVGTVRDGKLITLSFHLDDEGGTYRDDPQLVESVLNTIEWE